MFSQSITYAIIGLPYYIFKPPANNNFVLAKGEVATVNNYNWKDNITEVLKKGKFKELKGFLLRMKDVKAILRKRKKERLSNEQLPQSIAEHNAFFQVYNREEFLHRKMKRRGG